MRVMIALWALCLAQAGFAQLPVVGEPLPLLEVSEDGTISLENDELVYHPWTSRSLAGTPVYLQHLAARSSVEGMNKALDDAIEAREYPPERFRGVAIVNVDDAMWGTGAFVIGQLKKNKRRYPESTIVVDQEGQVREQLGLEEKNAAVIVLSAAGEVLFFQQGPLTETQVEQVLAIFDEQVGS